MLRRTPLLLLLLLQTRVQIQIPAGGGIGRSDRARPESQSGIDGGGDGVKGLFDGGFNGGAGETGFAHDPADAGVVENGYD